MRFDKGKYFQEQIFATNVNAATEQLEAKMHARSTLH